MGGCSKFNYSFLQLDQTDLFDTKNTFFTKPVNLVQQQYMVSRRGLKDSERIRQRKGSQQNSSQVTLLSHKMRRNKEDLDAWFSAAPS